MSKRAFQSSAAAAAAAAAKSLQSCRLCATPQMAAHQAPPSLGFSRQEHWSGVPLPSPRVLEAILKNYSHLRRALWGPLSHSQSEVQVTAWTCDSSLKWKGASLVAQSVKNPPATQKTQVRSLGWEDLLEKGMAAHSNILAGESWGQRSLVG